jgi:hypothetical protein
MVGPKISSLVAEHELDVSSARQIISTPEGSAGLIQGTNTLCFVSVCRALGTVGECVPEGWAAQHQGLGIVGKLADGGGLAQGVVPEGNTQSEFADSTGAKTRVSLNSDGAYSAVMPTTPVSVTFRSSNGETVEQPLPGAGRPTSYQPHARS